MNSSGGFIRFRDSKRRVRVGKIVCLGRNYQEHAREMNEELPERPVLFLKPASSIIHNGESVNIPPFSSNVHHEVEMVVLIGKWAKDVASAKASEFIGGYGVGLDMTLRDVQSEAKQKGLPWAVAKGFDTSAPVSEFVRPQEVPDPQDLPLSLRVNGKIRQNSNTRHMIFPVTKLISYISSIFTLEPGDLIFTGTPEGVDRTVEGDHLLAELGDVAKVSVNVTSH
jgi:5-carboxymethyl-2-hydroxymuconate isomerase